MTHKRVLIVGGGAIGLAIGWRVARAGCAVSLFDRDQAGRSASWASAGMLSPLAEVQFEEEQESVAWFWPVNLFTEEALKVLGLGASNAAFPCDGLDSSRLAV